MTGGWRLVVVAFVMPLAMARPEPLAGHQLEVTLTEAVRRALDVQPAVVQARGGGTHAGWQERAAYGAFLPTVTSGAAAFRQHTPALGNGPPGDAGNHPH